MFDVTDYFTNRFFDQITFFVTKILREIKVGESMPSIFSISIHFEAFNLNDFLQFMKGNHKMAK